MGDPLVVPSGMFENSSTKTTAVLVAVLAIVSIAAGGVTVTAQEADANTDTAETIDQQETSYLRVMHASPGAPDVDVHVTKMDENDSMMDDNDTMMDENDSVMEGDDSMMAGTGPFVTGVAFGETSDYQMVAGGEYTVTVTPAGDNETVLFEENVTIEPRTANTFALSGNATDMSSMDSESEPAAAVEGDANESDEEDTLEAEGALDNESAGMSSGLQSAHYVDNALDPEDNSTAIRVLHLSPSAPAVDVVTANGTVLAENVTFGNSSEYMTVPAGDYTVEVRAAHQSGADNESAEPIGADNETAEPVDEETETEAPADEDEETDEPIGEDNETMTATETPAAMDGENASQVGTGEVVATVNVTLEGGNAYSAAAVGLNEETEDADATALDVHLIEDATMTLSPMMDENEPSDSDDEIDAGTGTETPTEATP